MAGCLLLVWLLFRLGYDKRALFGPGPLWPPGWCLSAIWFTPPAGAHLADPNIPVNLNYVYGFNDQQPQNRINQNLYVVLLLGVLWLVAFFPTHVLLRKIFGRETPHGYRVFPPPIFMKTK